MGTGGPIFGHPLPARRFVAPDSDRLPAEELVGNLPAVGVFEQLEIIGEGGRTMHQGDPGAG